MPYTVRLCRDASGWFGSLGDSIPIPAAYVCAEVTREDLVAAVALLEQTNALAAQYNAWEAGSVASFPRGSAPSPVPL